MNENDLQYQSFCLLPILLLMISLFSIIILQNRRGQQKAKCNAKIVTAITINIK